MLIDGRETTINDREPTADDLAQMASRYTWSRMPEQSKIGWSASARELRSERDDWNPHLGLIR